LPLAQAQTPLSFGNNFFVTGDYVVAGAYNMTTSFQPINGVSYAVGTIRVPDVNSKGVPNPGIQGPTQVPKGAQVVVALLYWQAGSSHPGRHSGCYLSSARRRGWAKRSAEVDRYLRRRLLTKQRPADHGATH